MASYSEVKSGLDAIAEVIRNERLRLTQVKATAGASSTTLAALATDYADVVSTINAYGTSDASEALAKAELAKLVTEFSALKAAADTISVSDLG